MLDRILSLVAMVLDILSVVRGKSDDAATYAHHAWNTAELNYALLTDTQFGLSKLYDALALILQALPIGGIPSGAQVADDVWLYFPWPNLQATGEMLSECFSQAMWQGVLGKIPYHKSPYLAITGGNFIHDQNETPTDIPNLDLTLMAKGDTLLDWLNRCTDPWYWSLCSQPSGHYYALDSQTPGWMFLCTLTESEFLAERDRQAGPSDPTEVLLASGVTGAWDDTGGYLQYRVDLTTIPTWAGSRAGTPPLYEVNSRMHQLGWGMFGSGDAWESWQLLHWSNQILTTLLLSPTKFHLELVDGVEADVYAVY